MWISLGILNNLVGGIIFSGENKYIFRGFKYFFDDNNGLFNLL